MQLEAKDSATINVVSAAAAASGAFGLMTAVSVAGAGAVAVNEILTDTNAYIDSTDVQAGSISLDAQSTGTIQALISATSISAAISAGSSFGFGLGASVASNYIGSREDSDGGSNGAEVRAYILDSNISSGGAIDLQAVSEQSIKAAVLTATVVATASLGSDVGAAGSGTVTINRIGVDTQTFIEGGSVTAGDLSLMAANRSTIDVASA